MKKILCFLVALIVFCSVTVDSLVAIADNSNDFENYCQSEGIDYMSSHQYEILMNSLINGSDYSDSYYEATGSHKRGTYKVDLDKNNKTTDTNFTKPSLLDKIKSVLNLGKEVYDTTSNLIKDEIYGDSWDVQIPSAYELIGKTKFIYDSGVEELITLGVSFVRFYDKTVDLYRNKCTIYGTRQLISGGGAGNAATDFLVTENAGIYPVAYSDTFMLYYGSASSVPCTWQNSSGESQFTTTNCTFKQLGLTNLGGGTGTSYIWRLWFVSLQRQAIPYKKFSQYQTDDVLYNYNTSRVSVKDGILYAVSDISTNNYSDYIQTNSQTENVYSPSINYNNSFTGGTTINNNNYNDYGYTYDTTNNTWNTDQTWYNNWEQEWNNQTNYNYNNTYITMDVSGSEFGIENNITFDPFKEVTPEPTYPPATVPPTETNPPATIPPSETYPPATLPTETYRIIDFETLETVSLEVGTLPDVQEFPEVAEIGGLVLQQSTSFLDEIGLLPIYITLGILSIAVFIMRGQR